MTRAAFHRDLLDVEATVLQMGALYERDTILAVRLISETSVASVRRTIGSRCLAIMACQAPVARDLRKLMAIQMVVAELEQISDHALEIVQHIIQVRHVGNDIPGHTEVSALATALAKQVGAGIQALINGDAEQAHSVIQQTTDLASLCERQEVVVRTVRSHMTDEGSFATYLLLLSGLKRIARCANAIGLEVLEMAQAERAAWNRGRSRGHDRRG